jgi:hypothetical protein
MDSTKRIKIIFISIFILFTVQNIKSTTFAVWQGFEHQWKYNHRLNRLGDFIAQAPNQAQMPQYISSVHTGATGLGKDSATYKSYFSVIKSEELAYFPGIENFTLKGKQGKYFEITRTIFVPKQYLQNTNQFVSILNGFDIVSNAGADKIQLLNLEITDVMPSNKNDTFQFRIKIALVFNCTSFECNRFNKKFDYNITIRYLLLNAKNNKIASTKIPYQHKMSWTKEAYLSPINYEKSIPSNSQYKEAFLAYQHICLVLNTDHWFVSFANAITKTEVNKTTHKITYNTKSYYKQWEKDMQQTSQQSKFSSAKSGWGILMGNFVLVELQKASINNFVQDGCIFWNGKNQRPNTNACVNLNQIEIN